MLLEKFPKLPWDREIRTRKILEIKGPTKTVYASLS